MKKNFKFYVIAWTILVVIFNVICFVSPNLMTVDNVEFEKFGGGFWSGYIFIMLAFIGQLVCASFAFRKMSNDKFFLNLPLITISYTALIVSIIFGSVVMIVPDLPNWIGIILCMLILGFNAISVLKASTAANIVSDIDDKVKSQTLFIKSLTVDSENLIFKTSGKEAKSAVKKVYEAIRYSDPMTNDALSDIEAQIANSFNELSRFVAEKNGAETVAKADELLVLINDRNKKCKLYK